MKGFTYRSLLRALEAHEKGRRLADVIIRELGVRHALEILQAGMRLSEEAADGLFRCARPVGEHLEAWRGGGRKMGGISWSGDTTWQAVHTLSDSARPARTSSGFGWVCPRAPCVDAAAMTQSTATVGIRSIVLSLAPGE